MTNTMLRRIEFDGARVSGITVQRGDETKTIGAREVVPQARSLAHPFGPHSVDTGAVRDRAVERVGIHLECGQFRIRGFDLETTSRPGAP